MSPSSEQFLETALSLPEADRVELVESLISSLQPTDSPPFAEYWQEVIRRRSADLRSGRTTAIPWAEVKRQAREKLGE